MSSADIASARHRYLDMYPLTREQNDSTAYVDGLLTIDAAQTELRCKKRPNGPCPDCDKMERSIAMMRTALSANGIHDNDEFEVNVAAITAIFRRYFIVDPTTSTARKEVLAVIEQVLQREVGPDETLLPAGTIWKTFLRRMFSVTTTGKTPLRCRHRNRPLNPQDVAVEGL